MELIFKALLLGENFLKMAKIACLGDSATHDGSIVSSGSDGSFKVGGDIVAVDGAVFDCDDDGPGQSITPITIKSFHNGKLIITEGAVADCGAIISPPDRGVNVE